MFPFGQNLRFYRIFSGFERFSWIGRLLVWICASWARSGPPWAGIGIPAAVDLDLCTPVLCSAVECFILAGFCVDLTAAGAMRKPYAMLMFSCRMLHFGWILR